MRESGRGTTTEPLYDEYSDDQIEDVFNATLMLQTQFETSSRIPQMIPNDELFK